MNNDITNTTENKNLKNIKDLIGKIQTFKKAEDNISLYKSNKDLLNSLFKTLNKNNIEDITLRLIAIDNIYSTQMRLYYGFQDLAEKLRILHNGQSLSNKFKEIAKDPKSLKYANKNFFDNLFNYKYGMGKNNIEYKVKATSLISKYAYYETEFKFPIYDSIVKEMYKKVWNYCGFNSPEESPMTINNGIIEYIEAINTLREKLDLDIENTSTYDDLDMLLWHLGKIYKGTPCAILSRTDYETFVKTFNSKYNNKKGFDLKKKDIKQLTFNNNKSTLEKFFEIAIDIKETTK